MDKLLCIRPKAIPKTTIQRDIRKVVSLADAPAILVNDGKTLEWSFGNATAAVTPDELKKVSRATGIQTLNPEKVRQIKSLMLTMTCAQIVKHFRGRNGYAERTIKRYHAALSKSCGEGE